MRISDWSSDVCSSDLLWIVDVARLDRHVAAQELVIELAAIVDLRDREIAKAILRPGLEMQYGRGGVVGRLHAQHRQHVVGVELAFGKIGRASCRGRVCEYV